MTSNLTWLDQFEYLSQEYSLIKNNRAIHKPSLICDDTFFKIDSNVCVFEVKYENIFTAIDIRLITDEMVGKVVSVGVLMHELLIY